MPPSPSRSCRRYGPSLSGIRSSEAIAPPEYGAQANIPITIACPQVTGVAWRGVACPERWLGRVVREFGPGEGSGAAVAVGEVAEEGAWEEADGAGGQLVLGARDGERATQGHRVEAGPGHGVGVQPGDAGQVADLNVVGLVELGVGEAREQRGDMDVGAGQLGGQALGQRGE